MKSKKKYLVINILLFALLYFAVDFNKTYLRPTYGHIDSLNIILGSLPNFLAALIIHLCALPFVLFKIKKRKRGAFYLIGLLIFAVLSFEEFMPLWGASSVYDIGDIIANAFGIILAIAVFEIIQYRNKLESTT